MKLSNQGSSISSNLMRTSFVNSSFKTPQSKLNLNMSLIDSSDDLTGMATMTPKDVEVYLQSSPQAFLGLAKKYRLSVLGI